MPIVGRSALTPYDAQLQSDTGYKLDNLIDANALEIDDRKRKTRPTRASSSQTATATRMVVFSARGYAGAANDQTPPAPAAR
jgi:hypothetical protein